MGVRVSQEWKDNQKAIVRRPGFVLIEIRDENGKGFYDENGKPITKMPYNKLSYRVEKNNDAVRYISDNVGLEYMYSCWLKIYFNRDLAGDNLPIITPYGAGGDKHLFNIKYTEYGYEIQVLDGLSYVEVLCEDDIVTNMEWSADGIPRCDISSYEHSRSYDPMGLELPTNNISIDIFNYDDKYTDFYKSYVHEPYSIGVKYGYSLESGDEIIRGGSFIMTDVQLSDSVLTITGDSSLSQIDDKTQVNIFDLKGENGYIRVPVSDDASIETVDLSNREELSITSGDILKYLRDKCGVNLVWFSGVNLSAQIVNTAINASYKELLQAVVNLTLDRCYIDRYDILQYSRKSATVPSDGEDILMMNCFEKPSYSSTKKIKSFEITDYALGNTQIAEEKTTGHSESGDSTGRVKLDTLSIKLLSVDVSWFSNIDGIYYLDIYPDNVSVRYHHNSHEEWERGMHVEYASFDEGIIVSNVDSSGAICDINSPLGTPANLDKIVKYFSNRDLYTFKVRGNPARDVGDYINVSLTDDSDPSTYKKGLVLSSTLSYNGSFKEEITVRIIENEFEGETDNGNNV